MSRNILEIEHYSKIYADGKKAVDDLSLTVQSGEIHAFIGHNGAGKTTTIRGVVGIMDFEEGDIRIDGHSVKKEPVLCKSRQSSRAVSADLRYGRRQAHL